MLEKLITDQKNDFEGLDILIDSLKTLHDVVNKIVFLKKHTVELIFKGLVVINKNETPDEEVVNRGMKYLESMMQKALMQVGAKT